LARKILLADDSVTAQNMGRKILTDAGYEVVTVNNGSAALKKIAEGKPDLIVLDVYMPGYSGLEVCQRIKENRETARIPILLTVGKLEPFKPEEARRARADAFVVKPFEASELLSALTKLEDKIIPGAEPYKQGRFAKAVASVDQESDGEKFGDSDGGWKARLRIPAGKPKNAEPAVDYAATQGKGVRDYVETPGKNLPPPPPVSAAMAERPVPNGIPHDITPEEIAAITAAAAQLSGNPAPSVAPEEADHREGSVEATAGNDAARELPQESEPVTFANSPTLAEAAEVSGDVQLAAVAAQDSPLPELMVEAALAEAVVTPVDAAHEIPGIRVADTIAPDPPAPPAMEAEEGPIEPAADATPVPVAVTDQPPAASVVETPAPSAEVIQAVPPPEAVAEVAVPHSTAAHTADDEVMAALQNLIPNSENDGSVAAETPWTGAGTTFPAHAAHPRWIAEEISLAGNEATMSLEQEMAEAYGTFSGHTAHPAETPSPQSSTPPFESATALSPETIEQPTVQAMASAAGAGDGATAYSGLTAHTPPESALPTQAAECAPPIPEAAPTEALPAAELAQDAIHSPEGEVMAASWKNIRDSIAGAAAKPAPTKEEFREVEQASGARHDAATADQGSQQPKASDPTAIANIVDSVLAELRPRIVEEIARKLADPKKE